MSLPANSLPEDAKTRANPVGAVLTAKLVCWLCKFAVKTAPTKATATAPPQPSAPEPRP